MRRLDDVIPLPASLIPAPEPFKFQQSTRIVAPPRGDRVATHLAEALRAATGLAIPVTPAAARPSSGDVQLSFGGDGPGESYEIHISGPGVQVTAPAEAGLFAAAQTLRQLADRDATLPGGRIADQPRFAYRGVLLDVARHFFTVAEVRAVIDLIAQFKINHLHLHLTDDQAWRIEIPGWPLLTTVSGASGSGVDGESPGFYTRDHFAELVAFAADRFVTIVPEIDMPGHVNAAQFAYPELTADGRPVPRRTDTEVGYSSLPVHAGITYRFAEDVIRTVAAMSPGPYLHIGGDEAQATTAADYRTFLAKVLPLVSAYGKTAVGWHEIAAAGLTGPEIAQFWAREPADEHVARAVAAGHRVIMSPADRTYLDMKYHDGFPLGLDWAGLLDVDRAYDWDPATRLPGVGEEAVLGVEAALWSETVRTLADVQTMLLPRLPAVAEVAWSPQAARDWPDFRRRLATFGPRWTAAGIAFHPSPLINWQ